MDMIAFSLNKEINPERLVKSIAELIEKKVTSKEEAESSVLVISVSRVSRTVEENEAKLFIEANSSI